MTDTQKRLVRALQNGIPLTLDPYGDIARQVGVTRNEAISQIDEWKSAGVIRRMGAVLRHHKAGYSNNAMGAWNVPDEWSDEFGRTAAGFDSISHCYQRPRFEGFKYNLYTMIHGKSRPECEAIAKDLSERTGITDYTLLYTTAEYKKSSPVYFIDEEDK